MGWAAAGDGVGHPRRGAYRRLPGGGGRAVGSATGNATKGAANHVDATASGGAQEHVVSKTRAAARPHASPSPYPPNPVRPGAAPKIEVPGDTHVGARRVAERGVAVAAWGLSGNDDTSLWPARTSTNARRHTERVTPPATALRASRTGDHGA